ncbi:MAG TPA: DUF4149 domain-containing protein [Gammaproteobacteria bacterium]|nr:DUF4149 domain-containing protein [Gammaproteobacteria bacterium]
MKSLLIGEQIALTLWVGGMWIVGYVVAPVLFRTLDDRMLAGNLAGQMFTIMSYIGLVCAVLLLSGQWSALGVEVLRAWRFWLLVAMLAVVLVGQFVLQPMMAELKAAGLDGEHATSFGRLHGVASILFLFNSLAGLTLVVAGLRAAELP